MFLTKIGEQSIICVRAASTGMATQTLERKAEEFSTAAHEGQYRKDGVTPYITHPASVVALLKKIGVVDEEILSVGWLHDVVEDCNVPLERIRNEFTPRVADIVGRLTRDVDRETYKLRMRTASYATRIVKLADMVHNCSDLSDILPEKTVRRKVEDCLSTYLDIARETCPQFHSLLSDAIAPWRMTYAYR